MTSPNFAADAPKVSSTPKEEVDRLVKRFSAVYDALEGTATANNIAVTLMQGAVSAGQGGGFNIITLDIPSIVQGGYNRYR